MELKEYLAGDFKNDHRTLQRLARLCESTIDELEQVYRAFKCWPYELRDSSAQEPSDPTGTPDSPFSFSTTSMILHALAVATGTLKQSVVVPKVAMAHSSPGRLWTDAQMSSALDELVGQVQEQMKTNEGLVATRSTTWGHNDPLTLTWIVELIAGADQHAQVLGDIAQVCTNRIDRVLADPSIPVLESSQGRPTEHVFPVLKAIHLMRALETQMGTRIATNFQTLTDWLLQRLYLQLSYREIPDRGFDVAQMLFALEGLLLIQRDSVDDALIERAYKVLAGDMSHPATWAPIQPLTITPQGQVIVLQSMEVVNSWMRICDLLDDEGSRVYFEETLPHTYQYLDVLESKAVAIDFEAGGSRSTFHGWQSEHTYAPGIVHLWATSQVLLFLTAFRCLLDRHVMWTSRALLGCEVRTNSAARRASGDGVEGVRKSEPMLALPYGSKFRITDVVVERFLDTRGEGAGTPDFSFLLYGPPGTGKTRFVQKVAEALGWPLLILTPSDFIQEGEAGVEARARALFSGLLQQQDTVILFDEIDRLLLDRESERYGSQSDMFQFMTPSMLVKLNDLRKAERSVFVIATNFAESIDPAITRPGRLDHAFLFLPPDLLARRQQIEAELKALKCDDAEIADKDVVGQLAGLAPLYGFAELHQLCLRAETLRRVSGSWSGVAQRATTEVRPVASLASYAARLRKGNPTESLLSEALMLAYIAATGDVPVRASEKQLVGSLTASLSDNEALSAVLAPFAKTVLEWSDQ